MLKLYCPDLLEAFEKAVAEHAEWVVANRDHLPATLSDPETPTTRLHDLSADLDRTLQGLRAAREGLAQLIKATYPLGPMTPPA